MLIPSLIPPVNPQIAAITAPLPATDLGPSDAMTISSAFATATEAPAPAPSEMVMFAGIWLISLGFLTAFETIVVPLLKLNSILPDVPLVPGQLTERQKATPFICPLTVDREIILPTLDRLRKPEPYYVGKRLGIKQYITAYSTQEYRHVKGVQQRSEQWSKFYCNNTVVVFKQHPWK